MEGEGSESSQKIGTQSLRGGGSYHTEESGSWGMVDVFAVSLHGSVQLVAVFCIHLMFLKHKLMHKGT